MSRGKVHHPVHNVEAPAKRRKTSLRGIAIDIPTVRQGPELRRRLKSQQQPLKVRSASACPLSSGAGLASETATEHRRRHRTPQSSCPRCMYMQSQHHWERNYGCHTQSVGGRVVHTVWLAERTAKLGGQWAVGCLFCSAYARSRALPPRQRQAKGDRHATRRSRHWRLVFF